MDAVFLDMFKEVANIGTGTAATSLSVMLNKRIDLAVPNVKIVKFQELDLGEDKVVAVISEIFGEISGVIMYISTVESLKNITKILTGMGDNEAELTEMELSAVSEIGNILFNSYLTSMTQLFNIKYNATVPAICSDMMQTIYSIPATLMAKYSDRAVIVESIIKIEELNIKGDILFIPDENFLTYIKGMI